MTEIERKALALVNEVMAENGLNNTPFAYLSTAVNAQVLIRAIEQHEAFRQEVSDAVEKLLAWPSIRSQAIIVSNLSRFILPKPVDPLVEALDDLKDGRADNTTESYAACLRQALAARGLTITEIKEIAND